MALSIHLMNIPAASAGAAAGASAGASLKRKALKEIGITYLLHMTIVENLLREIVSILTFGNIEQPYPTQNFRNDSQLFMFCIHRNIKHQYSGSYK